MEEALEAAMIQASQEDWAFDLSRMILFCQLRTRDKAKL